MSLDVVTSAVIGGVGWIGILAKNYFTQMANLRVEEAKQNAINEQRRIDKQESYFERLFALFMTVVGEEKDERLAFRNEISRIGRDLLDNQRFASANLENLCNRLESSCGVTKVNR